MDYEYILSEKERVSKFEGSGDRRREKVGHVAFLTMNRPEVLNAMNRQLTEELHDAVARANEDDEIGCIVITGADTSPRAPAFSAGGDIHEQREDQAALNAGNLALEDMDMRSARRQRGSYDVSASDKPVIGMINGLAYGGGAVMSSSLDIRIGSDAARFRFLAAAYGRINSTWTLTNQVGWPQAKELLFTARVVEAEEAYRIGLLNYLVPVYRLREKTMDIATQIATNDTPSVIGIKRLLLQHMGGSLEQQWANERDFTTNVLRGTLAEEAFPEFLARRGRPVSGQ
jgi:enoyl-CoA hydratase/carnithine racemase